MFFHCPPLAGHLEAIGGYVRFQGSLDMRVRVLAAMVVAREFDALYVWGAQTGSARKQGVPESTITAIREKHSRGLPKEDAEIVDFTRTLLTRHRVSAESFESIRKRFGDEQLIELTGTIGYYSMLCMTVNACEAEAAPGAEVLQP
jgi:4-carboxymuconolactone decarboxylase